jgi:DNA-binding response OmpR family regulator
MQHATRQSVLIIEANPSLRRMITLGLQHRGLQTIEANSPASFPVSPSILPDLIVLDIDGETANSRALLAQAEAHPALSTLPIVTLTWENHLPPVVRDGDMRRSVPARLYLTKPFDARALHTAIEQLLLDVEESRVARKQENYLAMRRATTAPSIWPLVTAIGLLLAMIGLMLQITVTAIGLLIVMTALLCWTLGPKSEPEPAVV